MSDPSESFLIIKVAVIFAVCFVQLRKIGVKFDPTQTITIAIDKTSEVTFFLTTFAPFFLYPHNFRKLQLRFWN